MTKNSVIGEGVKKYDDSISITNSKILYDYEKHQKTEIGFIKTIKSMVNNLIENIKNS